MEPITHALTSVALSRALRKRLPRLGMAMLVTAGVAADLDFASYFWGPLAFLRFHRAVLHSLPGSFLLCVGVAAGFYLFDQVRRAGGEDAESARLNFLAAFWVCAVGAGAHMILDVASGIGVRLLWPFRGGWTAWNLLTDFDVWILAVLAAGLLLPHLFRLIGDEIGERKREKPGRLAAVTALVVVVLYVGGRGILRSRVGGLMGSRDYHGEAAEKIGVFATGSNPFLWRGLVSTATSIDELNVSVMPGASFDPDRAVSHYKPEASAAIGGAQTTDEGQLFLEYARFPLASIEKNETGSALTLRDVRFPAGDTSLDNIFLDVQLDGNARVVEESMRFAGARRSR
jgi:inner membrane protein